MRRNQLANGHFGTEWRPSSYFRASDTLPHGYLQESNRLFWVIRSSPGDLGNTHAFSLVAPFEPQGSAH